MTCFRCGRKGRATFNVQLRGAMAFFASSRRGGLDGRPACQRCAVYLERAVHDLDNAAVLAYGTHIADVGFYREEWNALLLADVKALLRLK